MPKSAGSGIYWIPSSCRQYATRNFTIANQGSISQMHPSRQSSRRVSTIYLTRPHSEVLYDGPPRPSSTAITERRPRRAVVQVPAVYDRLQYSSLSDHRPATPCATNYFKGISSSALAESRWATTAGYSLPADDAGVRPAIPSLRVASAIVRKPLPKASQRARFNERLTRIATIPELVARIPGSRCGCSLRFHSGLYTGSTVAIARPGETEAHKLQRPTA